MKLIITRHGQTHENVQEIIQGQKGPGRLNKAGIEQAKKLAKRLKNEKIDIAYVSDLERTDHTAREILKYHNNTRVFYPKELRERSCGIFEGRSSITYKKAYEKSKKEFHKYKPPKGESLEEVQKRVIKFYKKALNAHKKETILIVTHGAVITTLLLHLFNKPFKNLEEYSKFHHPNAAVTILEIDEKKKHKVYLLNDTKHLE